MVCLLTWQDVGNITVRDRIREDEMKRNILMVEDSNEDLEVYKVIFGPKYDLDIANSVQSARAKIRENDYQLVVLDLGLPDGSGFDLLAEFSKEFGIKKTSVMILSGYSEYDVKVNAFNYDIDQFVTKPVNLDELEARVESLLRKKNLSSNTDQVRYIGNLLIDAKSQKVSIRQPDGTYTDVSLTPLEFRILNFLADSKNEPKSRTQILEAVWSKNGNVTDRTVDTHICNLRKKLSGSTFNIETSPNLGYSLKTNITSG